MDLTKWKVLYCFKLTILLPMIIHSCLFKSLFFVIKLFYSWMFLCLLCQPKTVCASPKFFNAYLANALFHPYQLEESISRFRGVWCTFSFLFFFFFLLSTEISGSKLFAYIPKTGRYTKKVTDEIY